ncbi:3-hydroxyacyl-ACP dehydratase FabZ family protein [Coxiella endosymbiont of Ornithodoros maritimus]|uniref:3-hydroxyacyl-ACP dehydratase FabZ family protein n=1 Tax=Coxiella endosymbiont of Ornithodoros maritimus TaxID=1656172 RepID=UPI002264270F|nr:3-hydroxyacyl-ACP dehydratase FabZ family protein [Coxiella endosymbiont of Ornithodoros maritimus]
MHESTYRKFTALNLQPYSATELVEAIPQKPPFWFINKILSVDENCIEGIYTFKPTEFFYQGHFPGNPLTLGVILLESMTQVDLVASRLYLLSKEIARNEVMNLVPLFTDENVEFFSPIKPTDMITIRAKETLWRRKKLKSHAKTHKADGTLVGIAELGGIGVKNL